MSTVVALGHFCEVHGPRLVFYTIRNVHEPQFVSQCPDLKFCSGCKAPLHEGYISTVQTVHANSSSGTSAAASTSHKKSSNSSSAPAVSNGHTSSHPGLQKGLKVSASSQTLSRGINAPIPTQITNGVQNGCDSHSGESSGSDNCRPSSSTAAGGGGNNRPSTTTTTKYYCSHSNYDHSHLSHLHTCISRTLSCEVTPSNSVAFTSTDIWVIGTSFSLKDSQARGFHRKYCLVFTFLPEVPNCCQPEDSPPLLPPSLSNTKEGKRDSKHHQAHLRTCPKYKGDRKPPSRSHAQSLRDEYYSDGDHKAAYFSSSYGSQGYPSLVPYYDYITEEFYNVAKHLQGECDKVYYKEQSISPQRALRLSAFLEPEGSTAGPGGSSSLGGYGRSGGPKVFTRSHSSGARSLPLLSENPHIFLDLHEKFAKILHHVDL